MGEFIERLGDRRFPEADARHEYAVGTKDYQIREGIRVEPVLRLLRTPV